MISPCLKILKFSIKPQFDIRMERSYSSYEVKKVKKSPQLPQCVFITCQHLYIGKYVFRVFFICLFVCLSGWKITHNARTFLNKIRHTCVSKVSTEPFRFPNQSNKHTCQNDNFGKSVPHRGHFYLFVCLFVCRWKITHNSRTPSHIFIKSH